ncbi:helix-turn-helix transcriptional regulator [Streptomyces sp. H27-H5]|uniref:helix-turn-helix transcriptional regulator n=1 Tax=Streptomyces sp. H27-H5 TaxID=2996460 RepID=UPI00226F8769|nr:WYL domain-containing protein [Streptomyces sp. H27-H5]MCY0956053.1 WYL domain-containing protein [Streptomyces sp. H27-H5]
MRADRLLSLLLLLQNRGRMTAPELAAELEVSVRTVYRDVEALGASGVPVHADRGPAGGYRLMDGYRTRLTGLTDAQAGSLFLAGAPGPAEELGLGADLAAAQLKLRAALPAELAARAERIRARFHLDAPAWFREVDPVPHLGRIARAVWDQNVLDAHYRRPSGPVRRELHPLGLVLKGGIWYLVARSGEARSGEAPRTYRVGRFLAVDVLADTFERPDDFVLAAHWAETSDRLRAALNPQTARLRLSPRGRTLLPMRFGAAGTRALAAAEAAEEDADADGWTRVDLTVETTAVAVGDLLGLGAEVEVLGPPELRRALAETAAALADLYG